jgi:hypothetical protein
MLIRGRRISLECEVRGERWEQLAERAMLRNEQRRIVFEISHVFRTPFT